LTTPFADHVTFHREIAPLSSMESAAAMSKPREGVEAVYRADAERLWRAVYAFAGDAEIASDSVAEAFAQLLHRGGRPARKLRPHRRWSGPLEGSRGRGRAL
jgi:hypothetical protein